MWDFKNFPGDKPPDPRLQRAAASNAARGPTPASNAAVGGGEGIASNARGEGEGEGKGEGREGGGEGRGGQGRGGEGAP
jgi:hypothetical protein